MHLSANLTFELGRHIYVRVKLGGVPATSAHGRGSEVAKGLIDCEQCIAARSARFSAHARWTPVKPSTNSQTHHCGVCVGWSIMYVRVTH